VTENVRLWNGASRHRQRGGWGRADGGAERRRRQVRDPAIALAFRSGAAQGPGAAGRAFAAHFCSRRQHSHTLAGTGQRQAPGILSASPACRRQRTAARNAATRTSWSPSTTRWAYARASLRRSHMLHASAACRSPPPPARACSLLLNLKRHGTLNVKEAHFLTPCRISDLGCRVYG
jgi:hypothetical protein